MIFLNLWAFGLLGLAGVIALLYFLRRREESLTVSALWLWRKETERPRSALSFLWTKIWLLLLQIAALGGLAFALAAPTLPHEFFGGGTLAIIIDGSASMQTRDGSTTRYERAIALAIEKIERSRPARVTVIQAQREPRLLASLTEDQARAIAALKGSRPTLQADASGNRLLQMLRSQGELQNFREIFYVSDRPPSTSLEIPLTWKQVGQPSKNLAVTGFAARQAPEAALGISLWARAENFSDEPLEGLFKFYAEETELFSEPVRLGPEEARDLEALSLSSSARRFTAKLEVADDFALDNARYFVMPTRAQLRILWLGERNFFLERALGILATLAIESQEGFTETVDIESYDLVIANGIELPPLGTGRFLLINSSFGSLIQFSEGFAEPAPLRLLQAAHPLVQNVNLEHIQPLRLQRVQLASRVQTLVESDGHPLIASYATGRLRVVYLGVGLRESALVLTPSFPIFVQNIAHWLLPELAQPVERFVSDEAPALGFTGDDAQAWAVNLDSSESQINAPGARPSSYSNERPYTDIVRSQTPIWYYGAWAALGFLALEFFFYERSLFRRRREEWR